MTSIRVAVRATEGEDVVAMGVLIFAATSSSSFCTLLSVFNALSIDCLFVIPIPAPAPGGELNMRLSPPSPLLLLLLCLREALPLRGSLELLAADLDDERAEIVEVRRLAAGERGAGRMDERDGELGENGDVCASNVAALSAGREGSGTSSCESNSAVVGPKGNEASVGVVGECICMAGGGFRRCKPDSGSVSTSEADFVRGGALIANSWAARTGGERKEEDGDGKGDAADCESECRDHGGPATDLSNSPRFCPQLTFHWRKNHPQSSARCHATCCVCCCLHLLVTGHIS